MQRCHEMKNYQMLREYIGHEPLIGKNFARTQIQEN